MHAGIAADSRSGLAQSSSGSLQRFCRRRRRRRRRRSLRRFLFRPRGGLLRLRHARPAQPRAARFSREPAPGAWLHEAGGAGGAREVPSSPAAWGPGGKGSAAFQTSNTESGWEKDVVFLHSSPSWQQAVVESRSPNYLEVERTVTGTSLQLSPALVQDLFKTTSMWMAAVVGRMCRT